MVNLGRIARTIGDEVKDQEKMLGDMEEGVSEAQGKMNANLAKIEKILKTKDKCQIGTIVALIVVFIVLTAIVVMG